MFSDYYDSFVGADYDKIACFLDEQIKKFKPDSSLVCDLGCGTASVTERMSLKGYDPIGIDSDVGMLMKAREKLANDGVANVLLLEQDITDFELYGTVDVIYSTLDTLNYIIDFKALERLFALVYNYLEYDGLFIFDINSEYKFENVLSDNVYTFDCDDVFCSWHVGFDKDSGICTHELTCFSKTEDGHYARSDETQTQRYYRREEIESVADSYGFELLSLSDDYSDAVVGAETERLTYVLKINK